MAAEPFLVFQLGDARYAVHAGLVERAIPAVAVTPLPGAPAVVRGVVDVHGMLRPVYDARVRVGLPPLELRLSDRMLLMSVGGPDGVVVLVDAVENLVRLEEEALKTAEELTAQSTGMNGIARLEDGLAVILDIDHFLTTDEAAALERAMAE